MASSSDNHAFTGEVITVSCGAAANHVSALYFNHQWDEVRDTLPTSAASSAATSAAIDWRTLFRTVTTTTSSTPHHIPRLIAVSLPTQTGYYAGIGDVIDYAALLPSPAQHTAPPLPQWGGRTQVRADPDDIAALQRRQRGGATSGAADECWTDWLRVERLHDKNVYRLRPLQNEDDAFEYFTVGRETIQQHHAVDDVLDRVRWFAEECDHLQGVQLITDATNAWAGVADAVVEQLRDEYDRTPLVCLALHSPLRPSAASSNQSSTTHEVIPLSQLNSILSLTRLSEECDLYVPLFTPEGRASSPFIEQARQLALLWHHLSLPYCRNGPATDMRRMCNLLVPYNRANVLGCSFVMQQTPIQLSPFTPQQPHRQQHHMSNTTHQHQQDQPNPWRLHSLPILHQFQPYHTTPHPAHSTAPFTASSGGGSTGTPSGGRAGRHSRRKGAMVRDEDGEADDDDDDGERESGRWSSSVSPHFVLAELLVARGMSAPALSQFLAELTAMDPLESRQLCLMSEGVRVVDREREEKKESRQSVNTLSLASVCSLYSCDAIGDWLRGLSALAADVRRDAARGLMKMGREESHMNSDDWSDCVSALRDKAEAYYISTAHL